MIVRLKQHTPCPELVCAEAAAVCTNYTGDPMQALRGAMKSGHMSVLEHASFTFHASGVSRVLLAQLTRHRLASYSVQSQRYCGVNFDLVIPDSMAIPELVDDIITARRVVEDLYAKARSLGVEDEDARYLTFQAGKTSLTFTMNARELRTFFSLRCCNRAQWEIRQLADEMLRLCKQAAPVLFEHAGPGCVWDGCPEGDKCCGKPRRQDTWDPKREG